MVDGIYNYSYWGESKPTYILGPHIVTYGAYYHGFYQWFHPNFSPNYISEPRRWSLWCRGRGPLRLRVRMR